MTALASDSYVKSMKPEEFEVGGSGDMTDLKLEKSVTKSQKLPESPSSNGQASSASNSGVWTSNVSEKQYFIDKGASSTLGIGDGDKAAFPKLSGSSASDEKMSGTDRMSKKGGDGSSGGSLEFDEDENISVSQAGKKYIITKRNLIVNYLPQTFSDRQLFNLFVSYGPIDSVKIMRDATVDTIKH